MDEKKKRTKSFSSFLFSSFEITWPLCIVMFGSSLSLAGLFWKLNRIRKLFKLFNFGKKKNKKTLDIRHMNFNHFSKSVVKRYWITMDDEWIWCNFHFHLMRYKNGFTFKLKIISFKYTEWWEVYVYVGRFSMVLSCFSLTVMLPLLYVHYTFGLFQCEEFELFKQSHRFM